MGENVLEIKYICAHGMVSYYKGHTNKTIQKIKYLILFAFLFDFGKKIRKLWRKSEITVKINYNLNIRRKNESLTYFNTQCVIQQANEGREIFSFTIDSYSLVMSRFR